MNSEKPQEATCERCCGDIREARNAQGGRGFVVVLTEQDLTKALAEYVVKESNLPSCRFDADAKIVAKLDGTVEAIVEIVWWPKEPDVCTHVT